MLERCKVSRTSGDGVDGTYMGGGEMMGLKKQKKAS